MVESPTYYHALSPVLKSLQRFDMENFPLQDEVIHTLPSETPPKYLSENRTLDASIISTLDTSRPHSGGWHSNRWYFDRWHPDRRYSEGQMEVKTFLERFKSNSIKTPLEASQCAALAHALENKLAIIQGTR